LALCLVAGLAWVVTIAQAKGMGVGPGTMGLTLLAFLVLWVVMMAAMMFPSVAPMVVVWIRSVSSRSSRRERISGVALFLSGYLIAWAAFGLVVYGALLLSDRLVDGSPTVAKWVGVAIFAAAGIYQLTPLKEVCLRHCRSPIGSLFHYANFRGPARDLRVGLHHGAYCVACCWGLMIILIAVGTMNVAVMVALAIVIFIEKVWKYGRQFATAVGVVLLGIAVAAIWVSWLLPGLHMTTMPAAPMPGM
jgi:predicted metal-binding membrane protein